ncbi:MAG: hypothetical protein J7605_09185 [Variovorax sp.]|nr:hypothetical protein [Variovorax sp.]
MHQPIHRDASLPANAEADMFNGGPPLRLLSLWGRFDPTHQHVLRRATIVVCIGWLPLLLLAVVSYANGHEDVWRAFWRDASVHARSLIVAPLLILAEAICIPKLGATAQIFRQRAIVPDSQVPAYEKVVRSILWLRDWWVVEAIAVLLAYVIAALVMRNVPSTFLPDWHRGDGTLPLGRSSASWWNGLVSLPLLLVLLLGWLWRLFLWARYLLLVSRLKLRLVAVHPEGAAGLMFVGYSLRAFGVLGVAIGTIVAATELAHVWAGAPVGPDQLGFVALGTIVAVVLVFAAPLLVFFRPLLRCWEEGVVLYGALTQRVGEALEDKWMRGPPSDETEEPLSTGDFSATTDLFQSAANLYSLRFVPIDLNSVIALAVATALPFGVVALALVPFDKLLQHVLSMFV